MMRLLASDRWNFQRRYLQRTRETQRMQKGKPICQHRYFQKRITARLAVDISVTLVLFRSTFDSILFHFSSALHSIGFDEEEQRSSFHFPPRFRDSKAPLGGLRPVGFEPSTSSAFDADRLRV